ncbi:LPS assembly lipoprotein LptE [Billgrantia gudaonensis]|uniref:LPS-assembly lipoprotein n=1 Tax=Billgrantia gudaonensis TaxID=376427 RepID=A0A1G8TCV2_9GAMM|nr:LPS assembly lipoprotein LptE [Halomonas gudaonensis]SDJ38510.1 LPS-assembly lipoprotein [Halomonas gudaonensis]
MQRRTFLTRVLAGGTALALTGCGFRLRGFGESGTVIDELELAGPESELSRQLAERLRRDGTRLHAQAPWILTLGRPALDERRLSVLDAGSQEHEMVLSLPFSVQRRSDGAFVLPEQMLEVSERFTVSDDNLLAQEEIRREAETALHREAIRQLLERLRGLNRA